MKALALVAMLSACTTYNGSRRTAKVGGFVMLTGASVAAVGGGIRLVKGDGEEGPAWTALYLAVIGAVIFAPGAALGVGGLIGMAHHDKPVPPPQPPAPAITLSCATEARAITKSARLSADRFTSWPCEFALQQ